MIYSREGVGAPRMFSEVTDAADLSTAAACAALVPPSRPVSVRGIVRIPGKPAPSAFNCTQNRLLLKDASPLS